MQNYFTILLLRLVLFLATIIYHNQFKMYTHVTFGTNNTNITVVIDFSRWTKFFRLEPRSRFWTWYFFFKQVLIIKNVRQWFLTIFFVYPVKSHILTIHSFRSHLYRSMFWFLTGVHNRTQLFLFSSKQYCNQERKSQ